LSGSQITIITATIKTTYFSSLTYKQAVYKTNKTSLSNSELQIAAAAAEKTTVGYTVVYSTVTLVELTLISPGPQFSKT